METTKDDTATRPGAASAGALHKVKTPSAPYNTADELLAVLLHDLRSPLGAVGVLADLISAASGDGNAPEPRQVQLLQEAVNKAQRVLDDAVEIQALLRGQSLVTPVLVEASTIVRNSLEKAAHAPYFRHVQLDYDSTHEANIVSVDFEKAETAMLCALEQVSTPAEGVPTQIRVYYSVQRPFVNVHIVNARAAAPGSNEFERGNGTMRGRLGSRKLGESRFNLDLCSRVMRLMGGKLEYSAGDFGRLIMLQLPMGR